MKRIFAWFKSVKARFDAASQNFWGERRRLNQSLQEARFEIDKATREEITRKGIHFEENDAIANRLGDLFEQFVAGAKGLQIVPDSSDEKWNQQAAESWRKWQKFPDLISRQNFGTIQTLMCRTWFFQGEVFVHKVAGKSGRPRIRIYEPLRCYTPNERKEGEGVSIIDGIEVDPMGRPTGYWIRKDEKAENRDSVKNFDLVPAEEIIHLFEPSRTGQYRGLPMLYPVMNDLHDLSDLQILVKSAAKGVAKITAVITNAAGEADPSKLRRARANLNSQNSAGDTVTKADDQYFQSVLGAERVYIRNGEDIKILESNRPSVAEQSFWDYLLARICAGVGISKLLVLPYSMQGTVTRSDLDVANAFFRSRSSVLETAVMEIYEFYMDWARAYDKELGPPPKDWWKAKTRPPRAVNVDTGRNSSAMISEYQAGLRTLQDIYAENGDDWREQLRQRAEEAAYVNTLLADPKFKGVTAEQIVNPTGAQPVKPANPSEKQRLESQPI
jgi:lambda family phage portal protein